MKLGAVYSDLKKRAVTIPPVQDDKEFEQERFEFSGPQLRRIRKELNISIEEIASDTKINIRHLRNIEAEQYDLLPALVYVRGYVTLYARHLGIDRQEVVRQYIQRYREWQQCS